MQAERYELQVRGRRRIQPADPTNLGSDEAAFPPNVINSFLVSRLLSPVALPKKDGLNE